MTISVAKQLVEELRDSGVQRIYGLVGDSLNPIEVLRKGGVLCKTERQ